MLSQSITVFIKSITHILDYVTARGIYSNGIDGFQLIDTLFDVRLV